jgi:uncharacterized membrane protein YhaH (DUF805 family)
VVVGIAGLLAIGLAAGHGPAWGRMLLPLVTYPLYALVQLLVFLGFVVPRLRDVGTSRPMTVLTAAALFALLHWPNWLLAAACGLGALVWTWAYLHRRSLLAAAVAMGLLATAYKGFLPREWKHNLRTGPIYVQRLTDARDRARAHRREKARRQRREARQEVSPSRTSGGESR